MKLKNLFFSSLVLAMFCSCGTKKVAVLGKDLSMEQVVEQHMEAAPDFKTLVGRVHVTYADKSTTQSISISIRMKKDSAIWLSAKLAGILPLAKALITPEGVGYYEKINKTCFSGDFRLLGKWLGMELDFEKVQNLLTGQTIYDLDKENYSLKNTKSGLQFQSESGVFLKKLFLLNPRTYKAKAQQLVKENQNQSLTVTYPEYQEIPKGFFPKKINLVAIQGKESVKIDIEYRSLEFDVPVSFPFEIPKGYEKVKL